MSIDDMIRIKLGKHHVMQQAVGNSILLEVGPEVVADCMAITLLAVSSSTPSATFICSGSVNISICVADMLQTADGVGMRDVNVALHSLAGSSIAELSLVTKLSLVPDHLRPFFAQQMAIQRAAIEASTSSALGLAKTADADRTLADLAAAVRLTVDAAATATAPTDDRQTAERVARGAAELNSPNVYMPAPLWYGSLGGPITVALPRVGQQAGASQAAHLGRDRDVERSRVEHDASVDVSHSRVQAHSAAKRGHSGRAGRIVEPGGGSPGGHGLAVADLHHEADGHHGHGVAAGHAASDAPDLALVDRFLSDLLRWKAFTAHVAAQEASASDPSHVAHGGQAQDGPYWDAPAGMGAKDNAPADSAAVGGPAGSSPPMSPSRAWPSLARSPGRGLPGTVLSPKAKGKATGHTGKAERHDGSLAAVAPLPVPIIPKRLADSSIGDGIARSTEGLESALVATGVEPHTAARLVQTLALARVEEGRLGSSMASGRLVTLANLADEGSLAASGRAEGRGLNSAARGQSWTQSGPEASVTASLEKALPRTFRLLRDKETPGEFKAALRTIAEVAALREELSQARAGRQQQQDDDGERAGHRVGKRHHPQYQDEDEAYADGTVGANATDASYASAGAADLSGPGARRHVGRPALHSAGSRLGSPKGSPGGFPSRTRQDSSTVLDRSVTSDRSMPRPARRGSAVPRRPSTAGAGRAGAAHRSGASEAPGGTPGRDTVQYSRIAREAEWAQDPHYGEGLRRPSTAPAHTHAPQAPSGGGHDPVTGVRLPGHLRARIAALEEERRMGRIRARRDEEERALNASGLSPAAYRAGVLDATINSGSIANSSRMARDAQQANIAGQGDTSEVNVSFSLAHTSPSGGVARAFTAPPIRPPVVPPAGPSVPASVPLQRSPTALDAGTRGFPDDARTAAGNASLGASSLRPNDDRSTSVVSERDLSALQATSMTMASSTGAGAFAVAPMEAAAGKTGAATGARAAATETSTVSTAAIDGSRLHVASAAPAVQGAPSLSAAATGSAAGAGLTGGNTSMTEDGSSVFDIATVGAAVHAQEVSGAGSAATTGGMANVSTAVAVNTSGASAVSADGPVTQTKATSSPRTASGTALPSRLTPPKPVVMPGSAARNAGLAGHVTGGSVVSHEPDGDLLTGSGRRAVVYRPLESVEPQFRAMLSLAVHNRDEDLYQDDEAYYNAAAQAKAKEPPPGKAGMASAKKKDGKGGAADAKASGSAAGGPSTTAAAGMGGLLGELSACRNEQARRDLARAKGYVSVAAMLDAVFARQSNDTANKLGGKDTAGQSKARSSPSKASAAKATGAQQAQGGGAKDTADDSPVRSSNVGGAGQGKGKGSPARETAAVSGSSTSAPAISIAGAGKDDSGAAMMASKAGGGPTESKEPSPTAAGGAGMLSPSDPVRRSVTFSEGSPEGQPGSGKRGTGAGHKKRPSPGKGKSKTTSGHAAATAGDGKGGDTDVDIDEDQYDDDYEDEGYSSDSNNGIEEEDSLAGMTTAKGAARGRGMATPASGRRDRHGDRERDVDMLVDVTRITADTSGSAISGVSGASSGTGMLSVSSDSRGPAGRFGYSGNGTSTARKGSVTSEGQDDILSPGTPAIFKTTSRSTAGHGSASRPQSRAGDASESKSRDASRTGRDGSATMDRIDTSYDEDDIQEERYGEARHEAQRILEESGAKSRADRA